LLQTLAATTATHNTALTAETGRLQTALDTHTAALTGVTRILGDTQARVDTVAQAAADSVRMLNDILGRLPAAGLAGAAAPPPAGLAGAAAPPPAGSASASARPAPPAAPPPLVPPRGKAAQRPVSQDTNFIDPKYSTGDVTTPLSPGPVSPRGGTRSRPSVADITDDPAATADSVADGMLGEFP